jgi:serine/threonine-protein kinase
MKGASGESAPTAETPLLVDRYAIYDAIASGGMATVHLGRLIGTAGFLRTVAIKRLHSQFAHDVDFTAMFLDEARLASRIQHPNVVSTLDVVMKDDELLLVMEYIRGESLSRLIRRARDAGQPLPPRVVVAIMSGALHGLHAAHEAVDEKNASLGLVHRDMSPQNVLVGTDGIARVLDFGVAKAAGRVHTTRDGDIKGKVLYMAPEQLLAQPLTRTADVYAAGVVLFEALTSVRMFAGENEGAALTKIIHNEIQLPSQIDPALAPFDRIVRRATAAESSGRYPTALAMAGELEAYCGPAASHAEVSACMQGLVGELLDQRARIVAEIERSSTRSKPPLPMPPSGSGIKASGTGISSAGRPSPALLPEPGATSVITPAAPPKRSSAALAGFALLLTLVAVLLVVIIAILLGRAPPPVAAATATAAPSPAPPSASAAQATPPPVASAPEPEPATAVLIRRPGSGAPSASAPPTTKAAPPSDKPVAPTRGRVNCDPPYVIDKNGHQHFIPECLK